MCGGTSDYAGDLLLWAGLSPRVRGNPGWTRHYAGLRGSIPACAGEPPWPATPTPPAQVYPRVCGGTRRSLRYDRDADGLSPRVRGNPGIGVLALINRRSIPACAGEPLRRRLGRPARWVYPRVCGGTFTTKKRQPNGVGLSPRVRGNPDTPGQLARYLRSIPACAGEPCPGRRCPYGRRVYPRVCGGTGHRPGWSTPSRGLSPRVRGNRRRSGRRQGDGGSIPACAGEPRAG